MEAGTNSTTLAARLPILNPEEYDLWLMIEQEYEPTSAEEKQDRRNKMKVRGTLLMALLNKDQLKSIHIKMQNCSWKPLRRGSSSETMDQTFDRLQKFISQLEIQGEVCKT
ncbi:hypothetical protein Tco_1027460, partial [Tanacetum coccineum]